MVEFIFLTSGPIDYSFSNTSLYKSILETSFSLRFPALRKEARAKIKNRIRRLGLQEKRLRILSASSRQTKETAYIIGQIFKIPFKVDKRLDAIPFDFRKIMSEREFRLRGDQAFDIARPGFLKAFFDNELLESKLSVKERIDSFFKDHLRSLHSLLVISHSFLLMIMRAYLVAGEKAFYDYEILHKLCQPEKRPFGFLEGFEVKMQNLKAKSLDMLK